MFWKKTLVTCVMVALLSTPLISNAAFDTYNHTNEDSSVRITSGTYGPCSMDFGIYTPKQSSNGTPGHSSASDSQITVLCYSSLNNTCTADIYNDKNCTPGHKVGHATLDLKTFKVTSVISDDPIYDFDKHDGTRLDITYTH